ncbi:MAG: GTP-binding protein [Treponemataceae bacterium]|nr:GTP-binding protein [Treponemataceae bacterium]
MKKNLIPVTLLTGYLGAGKTTLLNYVLNNQKGYKVAVIVNDIGEVNIDADLIAKGAGIVQEDKDSLVPLQNGCICCTLKTDLMNQIISLARSGRFDYILIEASGICEPMPIAQTIEALSGATGDRAIPAVCRLDNIVTVVDAARLVTEFGSGNSLLKKDLDEEDIEALLIQQIEFCNTVLINKTDLVTPEQLKEVEAVVKTLQPTAKLIETQKGVTELSNILGTNAFDFEKVYASAGWIKQMEELEAEPEHHHEDDDDAHEHHHHDDHDHEHHHHHDDDEHEHHHDNDDEHGHEHEHEEDEHHHDHDDDDDHDEHEHGHHHGHHHHHHHHEGGEVEEYGIGTFLYLRRRPFVREKLEEFASSWPSTVIRAKGLVWFSDDNEAAYVIEQAGKQINCGYSGDWLATAPKGQIKKVLEADPEAAKSWDEEIGDRMIKLVFIGRHMDKEAICAALDKCTADPDL